MSVTATNPEFKFDPRLYQRMIKVRGASDKEYLDVKWRVVWLRSEDRNAQIETEKVHLDDKSAIFVARIRTSSGGVSVAHGSETKDDFADYIEKAESKAIGRALANLGYSEEWKTFVIDQRRAQREASQSAAAAAGAAIAVEQQRAQHDAHRSGDQLAVTAPVALPEPPAAVTATPTPTPAPAPAPASKAASRRTAAPRLTTAAPAAGEPTPIRPREGDDRKFYTGEWGEFSIDDFAYVTERGAIGAEPAQQLRDHLHANGYSALAALAHIHKLEAAAAAEGAIAADQATQPHILDELRPSLAKSLLHYTTYNPATHLTA